MTRCRPSDDYFRARFLIIHDQVEESEGGLGMTKLAFSVAAAAMLAGLPVATPAQAQNCRDAFIVIRMDDGRTVSRRERRCDAPPPVQRNCRTLFMKIVADDGRTIMRKERRCG